MRTFPPSVEEKLGFDVLRALWRGFARSAMAREWIAARRPTSDRAWVERELRLVDEMKTLREEDDPLPLNNLHDLRTTLQRATPEDALVSPEELLEAREVLITLRRVRSYVERRQGAYPGIEAIAKRIRVLTELEDSIDEVVEPPGRVRDSASDGLRDIRRTIVRKQTSLRETLRQELQDAIGRGYAAEEQPTLRAGRMVIPVRAEAKRKIDGFVQDVSSSGQTVYIEPAACLDLNNELRALEADEKREVERLLRRVTSDVGAERKALEGNLDILTRLDVLQAKMLFAREIAAVPPQVAEEPVIDIRDGCNPVLLLHLRRWQSEHEGKRAIVPLDLSLGVDYHTLVVTGPNAGGKTVAMKTAGLFALMLAYGLPLPAHPSTKLGLFDRLIVDIGDEQSIEEDLSTFSSHVSRLDYMLSHADERTLVLIDEAGTGTDPAEGGALAQSVLEQLTRRGARTIATTHHGTLKVYAHNAGGVENGSMTFDQATLEPTFRFRAGLPGSSYAFEIARRIGLPDETLTRARKLAGEEKTAMENIIEEYETRRQDLERQLGDAERSRDDANRAEQRYAERRRKLDRESEDIRRQALEEAERIVAEANARVERAIREIKEAEAESEATRRAREDLDEYREDMERAVPEPPAQRGASQEEQPVATTDDPVRQGDLVVLDEGAMTAEVVAIRNGEAELVMGAMRIRASLDRIRKVSDGRRQQESLAQRRYDSPVTPRLADVSRTIDLHGARVREALEKVEPFIDRAIAAELNQVEIQHGRGTGALRTAVQEYLKGRPDVKRFEEAPWNQGGAGVTIAWL